MALKAGYKGVKKSVLDSLLTLLGSVVIKEIGDGLTLDSDGELFADINDVGDGLTLSESGTASVDIDTDTMEFTETGKLACKNSGGVEVKTMTYTGDGQSTSTIDFAEELLLPTVILGICGESANGYYACSTPVLYGVQERVFCYWSQAGLVNKNSSPNIVSYTDNNSKMHITAANSGEAMNDNGKTYTVYYI